LEDFGPLLVFFVLNARGAEWFDRSETDGLLIATAGFMAALVVSLVLSYARGGKPNNMTLASGGFVFVFGSLTLFLQDETFIKIKPTIVYLLFAGVLSFGLLRGKSYLKFLLGQALSMEPRGWLVLTRRWVCFFLLLAALNEFIWRNYPTDIWVNFKVFGILPLTFAFMALQMPLLKKYGALNDLKRD
jgi:intracellular septation protein